MKMLNAKSKNEHPTTELRNEIDYNFDVTNGFVELDVLSQDEKSAKPSSLKKSFINNTEPGTPRSKTSLYTKTAAGERNSSTFKLRKVSKLNNFHPTLVINIRKVAQHRGW